MVALHFDNLLFLLLVAMAALLRLLVSKAGDAKKKSQSPGQEMASAPPRAPADSDEERIRKFLEALGQPTSSKPPPTVVPRADIPPRPVAPVQPPPGMRPFLPSTRADRRKREVKSAPPAINLPAQVIKAPEEEKQFKPTFAEPLVFEVQEGATESQPKPVITVPEVAYAAVTEDEGAPARKDLAVLLRSSSGLRQAIILREIFGPPRSLQPPDLTASA